MLPSLLGLIGFLLVGLYAAAAWIGGAAVALGATAASSTSLVSAATLVVALLRVVGGAVGVHELELSLSVQLLVAPALGVSHDEVNVLDAVGGDVTLLRLTS